MVGGGENRGNNFQSRKREETNKEKFPANRKRSSRKLVIGTSWEEQKKEKPGWTHPHEQPQNSEPIESTKRWKGPVFPRFVVFMRFGCFSPLEDGAGTEC